MVLKGKDSAGLSSSGGLDAPGWSWMGDLSILSRIDALGSLAILAFFDGSSWVLRNKIFVHFSLWN